MNKELKRTTVFLDEELFKKVKSKLALEGVTFIQWLRKQIRDYLGEY